MLISNLKLKKFDLNLLSERFLECRTWDVKDVLVNSETIYRVEYDFMNSAISIIVLRYKDELYLVNTCDSDRWLEPLLIQVDDSGLVLDVFLDKFILKNSKLDLSPYFINQADYSLLMDFVRSSPRFKSNDISHFTGDKKYFDFLNKGLLED